MKANFANDATISSQVEGHVTYLAPGGKPDYQSPYANDAKTIDTSTEDHMTYLAPGATGGREPSDALPLVPTVCPPGSEDTPGYVQLLDERENPIFDVDARGYSKMDCSPVPVGGETTDSEKHVYSNGEEEREVYVNV
ncbi:hypothetical protein PoB_002055700 [Plakobranchus ocellatus]|uniref:Uncharacterized protein n=1 Tax=Plakobranchus ocellatus TaxID=259542 RepID=A0AAV3ZFG1_9GAST|nr:hypothetical protein PoB_002055700 [Plakobranchus ocellatus]